MTKKTMSKLLNMLSKFFGVPKSSIIRILINSPSSKKNDTFTKFVTYLRDLK